MEKLSSHKVNQKSSSLDPFQLLKQQKNFMTNPPLGFRQNFCSQGFYEKCQKV